jgi:glycosyltransferase involved in cell wall biosynthesis
VRVVHLPFSYFPDGIGGTEVYVAALARELTPLGVTSVVAAPASGEASARYLHDDVPVYRYPVERNLRPRDLYGTGTRLGADAFARILRAERPDVVHMHALTFGVSLTLARTARAAGIPVVLTYHTPTVTCQRGTLLRNGVAVCDGVLDVGRCTACTLRQLGASDTTAELLSRVPVRLSRLGGRLGRDGGAWTALQMPALMQSRHDAVRALMHEVSAVVAVSAWVRDLLLANDVPPAKIVLSRQGLGYAAPRPRVPASGAAARGLAVRSVILTRLDPAKGVHVVLEALRSAPDLPLTLDVYGVAQDARQERYGERLRRLACDDARVRFLPSLATGDVVSALAGYDVLLAPSQGLETGPLVVLEAFAAGIPVIGSRLGGIAERVRPEVDGLLVEASSVGAWRLALQRITTEAGLLDGLRRGVRDPRTMAEVAVEMASLYCRLSPPALPSVPVGLAAGTTALP